MPIGGGDITVDWPDSARSCEQLHQRESQGYIGLMHALVQQGGMFAYMRACRAYLRQANHNCSLQNRAPVLPSSTLFEYFVLSLFFNRTVVYFFDTASWSYHSHSQWSEFVFDRFSGTDASITFSADKIVRFFRHPAADCRLDFFAILTRGWPSAWPVKINVIGNQ